MTPVVDVVTPIVDPVAPIIDPLLPCCRVSSPRPEERVLDAAPGGPAAVLPSAVIDLIAGVGLSPAAAPTTSPADLSDRTTAVLAAVVAMDPADSTSFAAVLIRSSSTPDAAADAAAAAVQDGHPAADSQVTRRRRRRHRVSPGSPVAPGPVGAPGCSGQASGGASGAGSPTSAALDRTDFLTVPSALGGYGCDHVASLLTRADEPGSSPD